ncbi:hypothetical protein HYV74_04120 [Candidatus Uhrbacteria bacterium]|nr:hypothetical protein [Candidatus Uhrbacteria bacterium]
MPPTSRTMKPADILGALLALTQTEHDVLPYDRTRLHHALCVARLASPMLTHLGCAAYPHEDHPIVDATLIQMQRARVLKIVETDGRCTIELSAVRYFDEIVLAKFTRDDLSALRRAAKIFGAALLGPEPTPTGA